MVFRAYLQSFLCRQHLVLGERFCARYPHPWLVWEPGTWKAPGPSVTVAETRLPGAALPLRAEGSDALCFELAPRANGSGTLRIGRGEENELVLSDDTVSREHCIVRVEGDRWFVRASDSVKAFNVADRPVPPGTEAPLAPGQTLVLGNVKLTFLDAAKFCARIGKAAAEL